MLIGVGCYDNVSNVGLCFVRLQTRDTFRRQRPHQLKQSFSSVCLFIEEFLLRLNFAAMSQSLKIKLAWAQAGQTGYKQRILYMFAKR